MLCTSRVRLSIFVKIFVTGMFTGAPYARPYGYLIIHLLAIHTEPTKFTELLRGLVTSLYMRKSISQVYAFIYRWSPV